jgi:hypothetical protein
VKTARQQQILEVLATELETRPGADRKSVV